MNNEREESRNAAIIFRSAQWPVFFRALRLARSRFKGFAVDALGQPGTSDRIASAGGAREIIEASSHRLTFGTVPVAALRRRWYAAAIVPTSDVSADGYFTLFLMAWLCGREAFWMNAGGELKPVGIFTLAELFMRAPLRWLAAIGAVLLTPLAALAAIIISAFGKRTSHPLLYIANDSWQDPLVMSHSLAWIKKAQAKAVFVSFEGRLSANTSIQFPLDEALRVEARFDPLFHRMLLRALPKIILVAAMSGARVVHARSYGPAFIAIALKKLLGLRFIFDTRGAWIEENELLGYYNTRPLAKRLDKALADAAYREADHVIAVGKGHAELIKRRYNPKAEPTLITCSVPAAFAVKSESRDEFRRRLGFEDKTVIGYSGSAVHYQSPELVAEIIAKAVSSNENFRGLVLSQDAAWFETLLQNAGAPQGKVLAISPARDELAAYTSCMDCALLIRKPSEAVDISFPSKLAEYLAAGAPVITSSNLGDVAALLAEWNAGVSLEWENINGDAIARTASAFMADREGYEKRCKDAAAKVFDMEIYIEELKRMWAE